MLENYREFTILGLFLILVGFALVIFPIIAKQFPSFKLPTIIWWTYRSDNFYFGTSPILIIVSIVSILIFILGRHLKG